MEQWLSNTSSSRPYLDNNRTTTTAVYTDWQAALIAVACGILVVGTVVGNVLVVTAVITVKRLRTPSNLLIVSLAISDLLVALLDMPFAAVYEVVTTNYRNNTQTRTDRDGGGGKCPTPF